MSQLCIYSVYIMGSYEVMTMTFIIIIVAIFMLLYIAGVDVGFIKGGANSRY